MSDDLTGTHARTLAVAHAGPLADPPAAPPGYTLLGELARGGMGVIFTARDHRLDRDVALKCVQGRFGRDPRAAARFVAEARITGRLEHPGVPPVHDLGTLPDGRPYLAMKLIHGRTLADLLADRPGPGHDLPRFVRVFEQVALTVGFAHSRGVIHRDLKPANVMVGAFGEVQVMDWGLAKDLSGGRQPPEEIAPGDASPRGADAPRSGSNADSTHPGSVLGTPAYMAPEQARGEIGALDERTDVFGLGAVLCVILTGQPPFAGGDALSTVRLAAAGDLAAAHARLDGCGADPELVALCRQCLSADPAGRPASGAAVAAAVAAYRAGVEDRLREAEVARAAAAVRAAEERRRRKLQLALAAAVVAALGLAGAGAWGVNAQRERQAAEAAVRAARARAAAEGDAEDADAALRAGRLAEAEANLRQAEARVAEAGSDDLAAAVAGLRADLDAHRLLDEAVERRWAVAGEKTGPELARPGFRAAFGRLGLTVGPDSAEAVGRAVAASRIRDRLVAGLDEWLEADPDMPGLVAALKVADPDPFRSACRAALAARDRAGLARLVKGADPAAVPPSFAATVAIPTALPPADGLGLLRAASARHPAHFPLAMAAGAAAIRPQTREAVDEALGYFRAAAALRPDNARARLMLTTAFTLRGDHAAAVAEAKEAVRLAPGVPRVQSALGTAHRQAGQLPEAEAAYRAALALAAEPPARVEALTGLGEVAYARADYPAAEAALREAAAARPDDPTALSYLADAVEAQGRLDEALELFRASVRANPESGYPYYRLGAAYFQRGLFREAAAALGRPEVADMPGGQGVTDVLRQALTEAGEFARAAELARAAVARAEAGTPARRAAEFAAERSDAAARFAAAVRAGKPPAVKRDGTDDLLDVFLLADVTRILGRPADAAGLYEYAFRLAKAVPVDVASAYKVPAARAAVAAAAAAPPDRRDRVRASALDWLAGEPDRLAGRFAAAPPDQRLAHRKAAWFLLADPGFGPVRDAAALAALPPAERDRWEAVWSQLRAVGASGSPREPAPPPRPAK